MCYPDNIEEKIDFGVIRDELRRVCSSPMGKEQADAMFMHTDFAAIRRMQQENREMMDILSDASLGFPRGEIYDLREPLARIRIEGLYLEENELFEIRKTLDYAVLLGRFFRALDAVRFPQLAQNERFTGWALLEHVVRQIDRVLDKYGRVADSASPELGRIRRELQHAQGSVGRALESILRHAQAEGLLDKSVTPTLREGRLVIPVPPAYKRKIGGIVHDESATGKTVYIEPQQVVDANNRIRELEGEERREKIRILQELTQQIRPEVPTILSCAEGLGFVDFLRAKALFGKAIGGVVPQLVETASIDWREARHPVLYLNFLRQNKTVVPLTIRLRATADQADSEAAAQVLVISGPNAGGKSVCLKTVALVQYMLQCGLPVPMREDSVAGVFARLMIDIGDEQSIDDDLSTYSSHLRNMKAFLRFADKTTLLLIDEFGSGTEPLIGGAMAEAVLGELVESGAAGVITTHYTNLKHFAERTEGVVNAAMLYDRGQMRPLFQLSVGQAGSSFAVEIAHNIGLPDAIIAKAKELVGEEHIDYDKQLQDIARDKRYWENKRQNIRQHEKRLEEKIAFYETEIAGLKAKRKEMMAKAQDEAAELLRQSNATIERTIREIRESKADKARTQAARQKVETLKAKVEKSAPKKEKKQPQVLHDFRDLKGVSKQLPSRQASVVNTIRSRKLNFERTLDLRGMRADEALEAFIAYLDDAIMVNAGDVTILHGTGTGALKQVVRDYLQTRNKQLRKRGVAEIEFSDGDPDRGGAGLTIIHV